MTKITDDEKSKSPTIKAGQEVKNINEWIELNDELDELKKIFFEFLKRWTDKPKNDLDPNRPVIYTVAEGTEVFMLQSDKANLLEDMTTTHYDTAT